MRLSGTALHAGRATAVTLDAHDGPLTLAQTNGHAAAVNALAAVRTDWGVTLSDGAGLRIDMVEHLMAAFAGLGIRHGVRALVDGPEVPLLDGGARLVVDTLMRMDLPRAEPALSIRRSAELRVGDATYRLTPSTSVEVTVEVRFDHPMLGTEEATWKGDPDDFVRRIAPARTFGFTRDAAELWARDRALGVDLDSVIVFTDTGVLPGCRPPAESELARHKLLDLVGDWACYGGPPLGRLEASRPGHSKTHEAVRRALLEGIVSRR